MFRRLRVNRQCLGKSELAGPRQGGAPGNGNIQVAAGSHADPQAVAILIDLLKRNVTEVTFNERINPASGFSGAVR